MADKGKLVFSGNALFLRCTNDSIAKTRIAEELSPAEEAARAAKEKAEQDALPYKWTQTIGELDLTFSVPGTYKSRDLKIDLQKSKIVAGVKGQEPIITVRRPTPFSRPFLILCTSYTSC
jgi:HSP20 family molecular chaperone IbpA